MMTAAALGKAHGSVRPKPAVAVESSACGHRNVVLLTSIPPSRAVLLVLTSFHITEMMLEQCCITHYSR